MTKDIQKDLVYLERVIHPSPLVDGKLKVNGYRLWCLDPERGQVWDQKLFTIIPARAVRCGCLRFASPFFHLSFRLF